MRDDQAETLRQRIAAEELNKRILQERLSLADQDSKRVGSVETVATHLKTQEENVVEQTKKVKELQEEWKNVGSIFHPIDTASQSIIRERLAGETAVLQLLVDNVDRTKQLLEARTVEVAEVEHTRAALQGQLNALTQAADEDDRRLKTMININAELDRQSKLIDEINGKRRQVEFGGASTPAALAAGASAAEIFATQGVSQVQALAQAVKGQGVPVSEEAFKIMLEAFREATGTIKLTTDQQAQTLGWVKQEVANINERLRVTRGGN